MDISFIIVNYKSEHYLQKCLSSLQRIDSSINFEILIVNNDETELLEELTIQWQKILRIINTNLNLGFGAACNLGAAAARGKYLFFLNPDTELITDNIGGLIKALDLPEMGIIAPRLITCQGNTQNWSCGHSLSLFLILRNNLNLIKDKSLWQKNDLTEVDWVSGAAFMILKETFHKIHGFDEKFFMYFEDLDLCARIKALNYKICVLPSVKILHVGGTSNENKKKQKELYYKSQDYYFRKHLGHIQAFLLKILRITLLFFKG